MKQFGLLVVITGISSTALGAPLDTLPASVRSNVHLWVTSDLGVTTTGSTVSSWANLSDDDETSATPDLKNFDQPLTGNQPLFVTNAPEINGHAYIAFDGLSGADADYLQTTEVAIMENMDSYEAFMVCRADSIQGFDVPRILSEEIVGTSVFNLTLKRPNPPLVRSTATMTGTNALVAESMSSAGTFHIYSVRLSTAGLGTLILDVDGIPVSTNLGLGQTASGVHSPLRMGATASTLSKDAGKVDVAELQIFNRELSFVERNSIGVALATKYALPSAYSNNVIRTTRFTDLPSRLQNDLHLWVASDVGVTLFTSNVSRWANMADNNVVDLDPRDLTQTMSGNRPLFVEMSPELAGRGYVHFSGVNGSLDADYLQTTETAIMEGMSEYEMFIVCRPDTSQGFNVPRILSEEEVGTSVFNLTLQRPNPPLLRSTPTMTDGNPVVRELTSSAGAFHIYSLRLSTIGGGTLSLDIDGNPIAETSAVGETATGVDSVLRMGAAAAVLNKDVGKVDVAELQIFSRELAPDDRQLVGYILAEKYGLTTAYSRPSGYERFEQIDPSRGNIRLDFYVLPGEVDFQFEQTTNLMNGTWVTFTNAPRAIWLQHGAYTNLSTGSQGLLSFCPIVKISTSEAVSDG